MSSLKAIVTASPLPVNQAPVKPLLSKEEKQFLDILATSIVNNIINKSPEKSATNFNNNKTRF